MRQYRLPASARLNDTTAIRAGIRGPIRWRGRWLLVRTARNQYGYARILVRVGKKLIRKASVRNRARRLIKEVFRLCRAALPARDYYITVAATLDQAHLRDARKELEQFFRLER